MAVVAYDCEARRFLDARIAHRVHQHSDPAVGDLQSVVDGGVEQSADMTAVVDHARMRQKQVRFVRPNDVRCAAH